MAQMSRRKRLLFMAIMLTSLLQMAQFALTPGIAKIQAEVFPDRTLSAVQTAMTLPSLLAMLFSLVSAFLVGRGLLSKKQSVMAGVALVAMTGLASLLLHSRFWHLCALSVLLGAGMGLYIPTSASIMFDSFSEAERRLGVGYQTSFINFGGIVMSVGGGYLATVVWYGGYLMLLMAAPILAVCLRAIPEDGRKRTSRSEGQNGGKARLPADVFYYGAIAFFFLLIYNVCGTNISNHLKAANLGNTATAGIATAVQMAGGVVAGLVFNRLSQRMKDYAIALAFVIVFVGYAVISLGQAVLALDFLGVFIVGTSISVLVPQCLFSTSNCVSAENSAKATAVVNSILPGLGGFLSPVVFTNLTSAIGGESTAFRFMFVGAVSLLFGVALAVSVSLRERAGKSDAAGGPV